MGQAARVETDAVRSDAHPKPGEGGLRAMAKKAKKARRRRPRSANAFRPLEDQRGSVTRSPFFYCLMIVGVLIAVTPSHTRTPNRVALRRACRRRPCPPARSPITVYFASRCGCGDERDEELAAAGVGPVEGHADGAAQVGPLVQLVANREPRPAFPVAARIAVLHDEIRDDAMDGHAGEVARARELDHRAHRERRVEHRQPHLDRALVGVDEELRSRTSARSRPPTSTSTGS